MVTTLIVLIILVAILLILVVLGQNSKGGTFASNFSASNQLIGVKKTGDLLEKLTWVFAISLMVLCLVVNLIITTPEAEGQTGTPATRNSDQQLAPMAPESQEEGTNEPATEPNNNADPLLDDTAN